MVWIIFLSFFVTVEYIIPQVHQGYKKSFFVLITRDIKKHSSLIVSRCFRIFTIFFPQVHGLLWQNRMSAAISYSIQRSTDGLESGRGGVLFRLLIFLSLFHFIYAFVCSGFQLRINLNLDKPPVLQNRKRCVYFFCREIYQAPV